MFLVIAAVKKTYKAKESFADNLSHNILKLFDVITFFFHCKWNEAWLFVVNLRKLENKKKISKLLWIIA